MSKTYEDVSDRIRMPMRAAAVVTFSHFDCGDYKQNGLEEISLDNQSFREANIETTCLLVKLSGRR